MPVVLASFALPFGQKVIPQPEQTLGGNGSRGTVHRFPLIVRVGGFCQIVVQPMKVRRASVPHGNTIGASILEIKIGGGLGGFCKEVDECPQPWSLSHPMGE